MIATKEPLGRRYRAHFSWGSHERSALLLDAGAVMLFLGLALAILARGVLFGDILDDPDILLQSIPAYTWYADSLREGQIPIWSSAILGGFPLAFGQYGFFYPPDMVLFRLLDVSRAFHLSLGLHLALAGISTYIYCRVLGLGRLPSLFAGLAFQMGNEVLEWPANGFITRTLFVLPALLAIAELLVRGRTRFWLALPVVIAAALLGGYAQILLFAIGFTALYVLFIAIASRGPARTAAAMAGVLLLAGVALGFGLAAVRVAPTLALTAMSTRASGIGLMRSSVDSIAPGDLLAGYMLPAITELGGNLAARPDYPGAAALFLAILALALGRRGRVPAFHGAAAVAAIALSLGSNTPLYGLLLNLPFFGYFRGPNRLSLVAALSISVLAAYALDSRLAGLLAHRRRTYFGIAVIAAALSVAVAAGTASSVLFQFGHDPFSERLRSVLVERGWDALNLLRPRVGLPVLLLAATPLLLLARARGRVSELKFVWILLIMSSCTLLTLGWLQNRWISSSELSQAPDFARIVKGSADGQRMLAWAPQVMAYNLAQHYQSLRGRQPSDSFKAQYERQFVPPNLGMLFGISTADGYEVLQSRRQALVSTYLGSSRREKATFADGTLVDDRAMTRQLPERLRFMEAVGVGYLANAFRLDDPEVQPVAEVSLKIYPDYPDVTSVYLYRLTNALPRAFLVASSAVATSEKELLEQLTAGSADLKRTVLLEGDPPVFQKALLSASDSRISVLEDKGDRVVVGFHTNGSGFMVLMDFLLPGWTASLDGQTVPILAANFAGRAIPVNDAGDHVAVFSYEAPLYREGLWVSVASSALLIVLWAWHWATMIRSAEPRS